MNTDPNTYLKELQDLERERDKALLRTLMQEYSTTLSRLPQLRQELDAALQSTESLDYEALANRSRIALQEATELLAEFDLLPSHLQSSPDISSFISTATTGMTLNNIGIILRKFRELCQSVTTAQQAAQQQTAHQEAERKAELARQATEQAEREAAQRRRKSTQGANWNTQKIGLDFGTTNSIICYPDDGELVPYRLGGAGGEFYVPSLLTIHREDNTTEIGQAARANLGDNDYRLYMGFKMLLGEDNPERLAARGYTDFSPRDAATAYLRELIGSYQREQGIQALDGVVLTVPEIWVREGRHHAREELDKLCREIGLPVLRLLSEPVAAAVYFTQAFQEREQRPFNGHVLVCDYGGGTLDLSLSQIEGNDITVLESAGFGNATDTLGRAGIAFDEGVMERLYTRAGRVLERDARWFRNLKDFEEQKRSKSDSITKALTLYLKNTKADKRLFQVDGLDVQCSDLADVFDTLIKPDLQRSLQEMQTHLQSYQIGARDGQSFRVLLVGGFSAFHLVQHTVRGFFGSHTDRDTRFDTAMSLTDTALAIAKGAALVAQETIRVHPKCPINLGIQASDKDTHEDTNLTILCRGTPIKSDTIVQYSDKKFRVSKAAALDKLPLTLWVDDGAGQVSYIKLGGKLRNYLPTDSAQDIWEIGFSVSQDLLFSLHIRVAGTGQEKITRLGDLSSNIS